MSYLPRRAYYLPLSIPLDENRHVQNPASLTVDTFYLLERELGNKMQEMGIKYETNLERVLQTKEEKKIKST